jgi:hypothetical protein
MKAAALCLILTLVFVMFCWYLVVPYLGLILLAMPALIVILGARDIWVATHKNARKPEGSPHPELRTN